MKRFALVLAGGLLALGLAQSSYANVYAAHLTRVDNGNGTFNLNYRLNENADTGVTIKIKDAGLAVVRTINAGAQTAGAQSVLWDGNNDVAAPVPAGTYSWEVTAADDGYSTITKISDDLNVNNQFFTPYGMAVNTDQASPYFGTIYVVDGVGGLTGSGRTLTEGVYILSNDQADITSQGNTGYTGSVTWAGTSSPFRCRIDAASNLFITDWSDSHSGIWVMDPANPGNAFAELLDNTGRDSSGLVAGLHGSISGCWIEGSGAGRVLYTLDEDYDGGLGAGGTGSVYAYAIGTATSGYNTPPTVEVNDVEVGNLAQNMNSCIAPDGTGNGWWISQYRSSEVATVPSLWHVNTSGVDTADWISAVNLPGVLTASAQAGMNLNLAKTKLVYAGSAYLKVLDISAFPTVTLEYEATLGNGLYSGTTSRDAAVDAAGNFYSTNSSAELLRVYSPGGGANSFATASPTGQDLVVSTSVRNWLNY